MTSRYIGSSGASYFTDMEHFRGRTDVATVDTVDMEEGVCNGFSPYTRFLGFLEFSGYHHWQQESQ